MHEFVNLIVNTNVQYPETPANPDKHPLDNVTINSPAGHTQPLILFRRRSWNNVDVTASLHKEHACIAPGRGLTFTYRSVFQRHAKKHQPGTQRYECWVPGCQYNGERGL